MTEMPAEPVPGLGTTLVPAVNIGEEGRKAFFLPPAGGVCGVMIRATRHRGPIPSVRRGGRTREGPRRGLRSRRYPGPPVSVI